MKLSPGVRPNLWHFLPCPETKGPWTTHHTLPGSGRPPSHLQPRPTVSSKLPTSSLQILPLAAPHPSPEQQPGFPNALQNSPVDAHRRSLPPLRQFAQGHHQPRSPAPVPPQGFCFTALQLATSNNVPQAQPLSHRPPRPRYQQLQPATPLSCPLPHGVQPRPPLPPSPPPVWASGVRLH